MKVGDGKIDINGLSSAEDVIQYVTSLTNTHSYVINKVLGNIFSTQGKNRVQSEHSLYELTESNVDWKHRLINNVYSESVMTSILYTISKFQSKQKRESMIIYFMSEGMGLRFKHIYKLETDLINLGETNPKIGEENKKINDLIFKWFSVNEKDTNRATVEFFKKVKSNYPEEVYYYLLGLKEDIIDFVTGNIYKRTEKFFKSSKMNIAFRKDLTSYRTEMFKYVYPTVEELCDHFNLQHNVYASNKLSGLKSLIDTFGIDLLKEGVVE